jgi:hypothetical protein
MGEQLRPRLRDFWEPRLEHCGDASVQLLALGLEEGLVSRVLDQGMLEAVCRVGRRATTEDQLGRNQLVEGALQLTLCTVGHGG